MATILNVSRSGYYKYKNHFAKKRNKYDVKIVDLTYYIWKKNKKVYGLNRILPEVKKIDSSYGEKRVRKIMNLLKIQGKQEKKFRIYTTDSDHNERVAPDLVKRDFEQTEQDRVWVSDITYLKNVSGFLYLCVILDLYSRKVVGWHISEKNDEALVISTIEKAINSRNPKHGLIFHSDRGSNYCSKKVRKLLIDNKLRRSNSRKGNCWDNAVAESFFSSLKREMGINYFYSLEDSNRIIFDHIEVFYNRQRTHSYLDYKTPDEFEKLSA